MGLKVIWSLTYALIAISYGSLLVLSTAIAQRKDQF